MFRSRCLSASFSGRRAVNVSVTVLKNNTERFAVTHIIAPTDSYLEAETVS